MTTLTRRRPGTVSPLGDPVASTTPDLELPGCTVYPRGSAEDTGRSATVVTGYTALIPDIDADIQPRDQIQYRGDWYAVEGRPGVWEFLDGQPAGLQIALSFGED